MLGIFHFPLENPASRPRSFTVINLLSSWMRYDVPVTFNETSCFFKPTLERKGATIVEIKKKYIAHLSTLIKCICKVPVIIYHGGGGVTWSSGETEGDH